MDTLAILQVLWYVLIAVLIAGYFVLDGFDLGVGILSRTLAKTPEERDVLALSIGPVWDGNEVWLITAGGALFAAFAPAYATSFSGFYLAIMLVLFALILRAVSLEFRAHDKEWQPLWDAFFLGGSFVAALLFGVAAGNVIQGVPLNAQGDYIGTFFGLLGPFPLLCGVVGLIHMMWQGAAWTVVKTVSGTGLHDRALKWRRILSVAMVVAFVALTCMYMGMTDAPSNGAVPQALGWAFAVVCVGAIGLATVLVLKSDNSEMAPFLATCASAIGLVGLWFSSAFPNLIVASNDPALSLTLWNSSSSEAGLFYMTVIACIGLPLVLLYHVIIYRTYRGKITL